jgi:hypothetical protein
MRILLVMPNPFENGRLGLENVVWLSEPVALTSVGAAVIDEHEVRVLDLRLEDEDALVRTLASFRPDVVGTTSMTTDAYQAKAVLRAAKNVLGDHALTVVGGHHPTLCPEEFDEPFFDVLYVVYRRANFRSGWFVEGPCGQVLHRHHLERRGHRGV